MTDYTPPHSIEAERCVIGGCFYGPKPLRQAQQLGLEDRHFYRPAHQIVWRAISKLAKFGREVDLVQVKDELESQGKLKSVGGVDALVDLMESVPSPANQRDYVGIVLAKAYRREKLEAIRAAMDVAANPSSEIAEIDEATRRAANVTPKGAKQLWTVGDFELGGKPSALPTFIPSVSLERGQTTVIQAETGQGKTVLAQDLAMDWAKRGYRVFFALLADLTVAQFIERLMTKETGWRYRPSINPIAMAKWDDAWASWADPYGDLRQNLVIYDAGESGCGATLSDVRQAIYEAHEIAPISVFVVDYFQVLEPDNPTGKDYIDNKRNSKALVKLAKELDVPGVVTSQVTRNEKKIQPMGGRGVEQDAGFVFTLWWELCDSSGKTTHTLEREHGSIAAKLTTNKTRFKHPGPISLLFDESHARFTYVESVDAK